MDRSEEKSRDLYKTDFERHLFAVGDPSGKVEEEKASLVEILAELLEQIPELYHETITLRFREGLSYDEIAERLAVPLGTVKSRLYRARQGLIRAFEEMENLRRERQENRVEEER